jgi:hypothetical protein
LYQKTATIGATLSYRFAIYREFAFGILAAPVEHLPLLAYSLHKLTAALGARDPGFN